ncbi:MAG: hypothetical protein JOZ97_02795 [Candidatus Eremiobacteraeota bacterium]|nr:hypothetical protein [Candidatus Eremiobacteraeota bacterium]
MILPWLLAVNFMNFKYYHIPCSDNVPVPAKLRQGKYHYFDRKMAADFDVYVTAVKEGSLYRGTRQAVVTVGCDFPVGGTSQAYLYNVRGDSATFVRTVGQANWGGDWGAGPSQIHVRFRNHRLYVDSCVGDTCDETVVKTFAYRDGRIKEISEHTHPTRQ